MKNVKKWPLITGTVATILITILSCLFFSLSAAFYRGSVISNLESENISASEIIRYENEYTAVDNIAIIYSYGCSYFDWMHTGFGTA